MAECVQNNNGATQKVPVQLLFKDKDEKWQLHSDQLEAMLKDEKVKDRQLVVVSVVGAFRRGKSFLLNFMLRYLRCNGRSDWIVDGGAISLEGFSWRGGPDRDTTGILVWPEVFLVGEDKALILMDTQGTFDSKTSFKDNAIIFALSTLVSSVQIYNLFERIQMDDLSNLQYFCEFGRIVNSKCSGAKAFQKVIFLIRDWKFPDRMKFGFQGGEKLLNEWIQDSTVNREQTEVIQTCFSEMSCFLMPHPGERVSNDESFRGELRDIDRKFVTYLETFIEDTLGRGSLVSKMVGGHLIAARDLPMYMRSWLKGLQDDSFEPMTLYESMVDIGHQKSARASLEDYEARMLVSCGGVNSVPNLPALHEEAASAALKLFDDSEKFGGKRHAKKARDALVKDIEAKFSEFSRQNLAKQQQEELHAMQQALQEAEQAALRSYQTGTEECGGVRYLPNLRDLHEAARRVALTKFSDLSRAYGEENKKPYIEKLEGKMSEQLISLEARNIEKMDREKQQRAREELREEWEKVVKKYRQSMEEKLGGTKTASDVEPVHEAAKREAIASFTRTASNHNRDIVEELMTKLQRDLEDSFLFFKLSNDDKLSKEQEEQIKESLRSAKEEAKKVYQMTMESRMSTTKSTPDLDSVHVMAMQNAATAFNLTANKFTAEAGPYAHGLGEDLATMYQLYQKKNSELVELERTTASQNEVRDARDEALGTLRAELFSTRVMSQDQVDGVASTALKRTLEQFDQVANKYPDNEEVRRVRRVIQTQSEELCAQWRSSQAERLQREAQNLLRDVQLSGSEALQSYQSALTTKCSGWQSVVDLRGFHESTKSDVITAFNRAVSDNPAVTAEVHKQLRLLEKKIDDMYTTFEKSNLDKQEYEKEKADKQTAEAQMEAAIRKFATKIQSESGLQSIEQLLLSCNVTKADVIREFRQALSSVNPETVERFSTRLANELEEKLQMQMTVARTGLESSSGGSSITKKVLRAVDAVVDVVSHPLSHGKK